MHLPVTATNLLFACSRKPQDADVENGSPSLPGLKFIEPLQMTMDDIVTSCCEELASVLLSWEKAHRHSSADLN